MVGDGMVLQRDMPIRIWGFGSMGEKVTVKFGGETASGVTENNGIWVVMLSPKKAGGPFTMDIDGINHLWLKNIMVGDVWVCAGGANMELSIGKIKDTDMAAHAGDYPIRRFHVPLRYEYKAPKENVNAHWETATDANASSFSALGWLFAREVNEHYHVPVGLIEVSAAEAPAEAWLSPGALRMFPAYATAAAQYADSSWAEGSGPADKMAPGGLYNGMIAPIWPYTVRGVIWWQGETNVGSAADYLRLFPTLVNDWRMHWGENNLAFLYVQLEGHGKVEPWGKAAVEPDGHGPAEQQSQESNWAVVREAQRLAMEIPSTGMVVSADLGETDEARPGNLREIGRRLFLAAENIVYGKKNFIYTGPVYHSMKAHGDKVHLVFDEVNRELIVKGGGELRGFTIAGADNRWVPAKAITDGKKVIVWSDSVEKPVAVRYGWSDNPAGINLFNRDILFKDGLPAAPFIGRVK